LDGSEDDVTGESDWWLAVTHIYTDTATATTVHVTTKILIVQSTVARLGIYHVRHNDLSYKRGLLMIYHGFLGYSTYGKVVFLSDNLNIALSVK
jgi:hypothetical protein